MVVSELKLYDLLKAKIGQEEAEAFIEILDNRVDKKFDEAKEHLATKADLANLETKLTRSIYIVGLVQYLAILASLIAILKFVM